jgi:hypothetical protein
VSLFALKFADNPPSFSKESEGRDLSWNHAWCSGFYAFAWVKLTLRNAKPSACRDRGNGRNLLHTVFQKWSTTRSTTLS